MMDKLRSATDSFLVKLILAIIILAFVITGIAGHLFGNPGNYALKINGEEIPMVHYEQAVQMERDRLQSQLGDQFSSIPNIIDIVKQNALDKLINEVLLDQYTKSLGLTLSDERVKEKIMQVPYFQVNGKFDNNTFQQIVNQLRMTPTRYAETLRQQSAREQLLDAYINSDFVLPNEADSLITLMKQSRDIQLATIKIDQLAKAQTYTDNELEGYYKQHSYQFLMPEQIKVSYIEINESAIKQHISVNDDEIEHYYQTHQNAYVIPEQRKYQTIELKTEQDAKNVLELLKKGEDFTALARSKSIDILVKKNDGYTDWLTNDETPPEVLAAKLKAKNDLSSVIKFNDTYMVARLADIKAKEQKSLNDVKSNIKDILLNDKASRDFSELQQKLREAAENDNDSLDNAKKAVNGKIITTDWFSRDNVPEEINQPLLLKAVFDENLRDVKGEALGNSDVISTADNRAFVFRVNGYQAEKTKPFDAVKSEIIKIIQRNKAVSQARINGDKILQALKTDKANKGEALMKEAGLSFSSMKTVTLQTVDPALRDTVFSLLAPTEKVPHTYGIAQNETGDVTLIELNAIHPGKIDNKDEKSVMESMLTDNQQSMLAVLILQLRQNADIKIGRMIQ